MRISPPYFRAESWTYLSDIPPPSQLAFFRREGQTHSSIPCCIFQKSQRLNTAPQPHIAPVVLIAFWFGFKVTMSIWRAYWKLIDCLSPTNNKDTYSPCRELWNLSREWWAPQPRYIIWKSLASISIAPFGDMPLNSLWGNEKLSCSQALSWDVGNLTPQCWTRR